MARGITARVIIREAEAIGICPEENVHDLADAFGWDEDMVDEAIRAVRDELTRRCGFVGPVVEVSA